VRRVDIEKAWRFLERARRIALVDCTPETETDAKSAMYAFTCMLGPDMLKELEWHRTKEDRQ
jgi:hypothetical protein